MDPESAAGPTTAACNGAIEHRSFARIGLLGNPSDVYYGNTISFSLANFWATVKLQPSHELVIQPHPIHDLVQFKSLGHLVFTFTSLSSSFMLNSNLN